MSTSPKVVYTYAYGTGGKFLRRTGMTYPDSTLGVAVRPTYDFGTAGGANDVLNRVGRIYQSFPAREFVQYGFARASRDILVALGSGVKLSFGTGANNYDAYDRFGRVLRMKWEKHLTLSSADDVKEWIEWDYDRVSNRKWRWNRKAAAAKGQDELYTYDGLYRLKTADRGTLNGTKTAITSSKHKEEWTDDLMGNWTGWKTFLNGSGTASPDQGRNHNVTNEITSVSPSAGAVNHDAVGNTTLSRPGVTGPWNQTQALQWDAWNRLVWRAGDTYRFDALHRRITKTVSSVIRHFYYSDQWQIVEERVGSATTADNQYVWGMRYIDELIYRRRGTTERYVLTDYFHPVAITDTTGNVIERFGYTPFGVARFMTAAYDNTTDAEAWCILYAGDYFDVESGFYQNRYRSLNPSTGRWLSRDPIGEDGGLNLYRYVENNPVNRVDVMGLSPFEFIKPRGQLMVDISCKGQQDLLKNVTYLAEKEPLQEGETKEAKKFRQLPTPGEFVYADAVYLGDGTAWKIPGTTTGVIFCFCDVDGKFQFRYEPGDLFIPKGESAEWKEGEQPPPLWPSGDRPNEKRDYDMPPYQGPPPQAPLPPLNPVNRHREIEDARRRFLR